MIRPPGGVAYRARTRLPYGHDTVRRREARGPYRITDMEEIVSRIPYPVPVNPAPPSRNAQPFNPLIDGRGVRRRMRSRLDMVERLGGRSQPDDVPFRIMWTARSRR
jgi:hypothetical protein